MHSYMFSNVLGGLLHILMSVLIQNFFDPCGAGTLQLCGVTYRGCARAWHCTATTHCSGSTPRKTGFFCRRADTVHFLRCVALPALLHVARDRRGSHPPLLQMERCGVWGPMIQGSWGMERSSIDSCRSTWRCSGHHKHSGWSTCLFFARRRFYQSRLKRYSTIFIKPPQPLNFACAQAMIPALSRGIMDKHRTPILLSLHNLVPTL